MDNSLLTLEIGRCAAGEPGVEMEKPFDIREKSINRGGGEDKTGWVKRLDKNKKMHVFIS